MYKATVYTPVNGRITHQKQQISEKWWYYTEWHNHALTNQTLNLILILSETVALILNSRQ